MTKVKIVAPQLSELLSDIINKQIKKEEQLLQARKEVVAHHRQWWNKWLYLWTTDEQILNESLYRWGELAQLRVDIADLEILSRMCADAISIDTEVWLDKEDYELIYGEH